MGKRKVKCNHCNKELSFRYNKSGFITDVSEQGWVLGYTLDFLVENKRFFDLCPDCYKKLKDPINKYLQDFQNKATQVFETFASECTGTSTEVVLLDGDKIYEYTLLNSRRKKWIK